MKRLSHWERTIPIIFAAVVAVCYGISIPWLGFYGDDWIYIHNYILLGSGSFGNFVAVDRPFSGWIYELVTPLFQDRAIYYHLLLLLLRWASVMLFWWVLKLIWPDNRRPVFWAALLFAVYPGFQQQPIAVQFILHFTILNLFLLSLICMLQAARQPTRRWLFTAGGIAGALGVFSLEYFAGLELLRPVLLWVVLGTQVPGFKMKLLKVFYHWLPYLAVLAGFAVWRVFIFEFPTYQPDMLRGILATPQETIPLLLKRMLGDLKTTGFDAWRQTVRLPDDNKVLAITLLIVIVIFGGTLASLKILNREEEPQGENQDGWGRQAIIVSLAAMLGAGIPFWVTGIKVELPFPWDRSTLPFMAGACLLLPGLFELAVRPRFRAAVMAGLVALSAGAHYRNALVYQGEWKNLRTYFSQLAWRAPGLEEGTILVSDEIPLFRFSDNDLTPIVNLVYAPDTRGAVVPYKYFDLSTRMNAALPGIEEGLPVVHNYRSHQFSSSTSKVLSIYYQLSGCLYVLGPEDGDFPRLPETIRDTLPISHINLIETTPAIEARLPGVFMGEAERDWCYYFEKAELAKQAEDWMMISFLATQVETLGLESYRSYELLPFIEGFLNLGETERLRHYVGLALEEEENRNYVCTRLEILRQKAAEGSPERQVLDEIKCNE